MSYTRVTSVHHFEERSDEKSAEKPRFLAAPSAGFEFDMRLVGTAGHVDHGKSTLVHALTGINPDRLKEEQEREMTIDLGFAWLTLPHGETISLVDVPGHEAFIKNMLAGAGGMDAVLLVVAADEGIMPQTREHLAILDLLNIQGGVVALTKTDLPLEPGWLDLVQEEIRVLLRGTVLEHAEIVPVSAKTRRGLDELVLALERALANVAEKADHGRPRLPIDRVFTMSGFGTVVTGTLSDGRLVVGEEVEILPRRVRARIRGLQAHKEKITTAYPGGRVAANLTGVATEELARGDTLIHPGTYEPTQLLDARLHWLATSPRPLRHSQELEFFLFSKQAMARVRLLESDALAPGQSGWAQLVLNRPVVAAKGDRFILRSPSPSLTLGGGEIVEPHPIGRHKRMHPQVLEQLARAGQGTPDEMILQYVEQHPAAESQEIARATGLEQKVTDETIASLLSAERLMALENERGRVLLARTTWERWRKRIVDAVTAYHTQYPFRAGMPREQLIQTLKSATRANVDTLSRTSVEMGILRDSMSVAPRVLEAALDRAVQEGLIQSRETLIALPNHRVTFDAATQAQVTALLDRFAQAPYNPPSWAEAEAMVGVEVLNALIAEGRLERISPSVLLEPRVVEEWKKWVIETIREKGEVTAATLRDRFQTSRKYAIAFLEYLDQKRITRREGDARVLRA